MKNGIGTGKIDDNGIEIKCGDKVSFYEFREGYIERHSQDGWGRTITLCRHDCYKIPNKEKTIEGTVRYSSTFTGFVVTFNECMLESGRTEQNLYMLGKSTNRPKNKLLVISP